ESRASALLCSHHKFAESASCFGSLKARSRPEFGLVESRASALLCSHHKFAENA
ncbi:13967_t:CDS:2, partial [Gigaspora rosea]